MSQDPHSGYFGEKGKYPTETHTAAAQTAEITIQVHTRVGGPFLTNRGLLRPFPRRRRDRAACGSGRVQALVTARHWTVGTPISGLQIKRPRYTFAAFDAQATWLVAQRILVPSH